MGRKCKRKSLPTRASERIKTLLAASLTYEGPKIFNSLPKEVRGITGCTVEKFKSGLDRFLSAVPDHPPVPGYTARYRAPPTLYPTKWLSRPGTTGPVAAVDHHGCEAGASRRYE